MMLSMTTRRLSYALALVSLSAAAGPEHNGSISQTMDVNGSPAAVWSAIGGFCDIKAWLPPVGTCTQDGKTPPTRTLVTKDGSATFVELQTARNDAKHFYSYTFVSSPLPLDRYNATISVVAKSSNVSTVTWQATYTPMQGKEKEAYSTLLGIYTAGLGGIKAKLETESFSQR
jgi:hypothetical protein